MERIIKRIREDLFKGNKKVVVDKKADASRHKIIIPNYYVDNFGLDYKMICYPDYMVIVPRNINPDDISELK